MVMTQRLKLGREKNVIGVMILGCAAAGFIGGGTARAAILMDGVTPYKQNFDTLTGTGSANPWADNSTLAGWYAVYTGTLGIPTGYRAVTTTSGNNSTGLMAFHSPSSPTNFALGGRGGGGSVSELRYGVILENNSSSTLDSVTIGYTGEEWQTPGVGTVGDVLNFAYQLSSTAPATSYTAASGDPLNMGTFTADTAMNYSIANPGTGTDTVIDGTLPANQATLSDTLTGLNWLPGTYLLLRWQDTNNASINDASLAMESVTVTATSTTAAPEPSSMLLLALGGAGLVQRRRRKMS